MPKLKKLPLVQLEDCMDRFIVSDAGFQLIQNILTEYRRPEQPPKKMPQRTKSTKQPSK